VLGRVGRRLARSVDQRARALVEGQIPHDYDVDRDAMHALDPIGHRIHRFAKHLPVAGRRAPVQPRAQLALLRARERRHLLRAGRALDHRQRLEDRVVQVSGHLGALLGTDPHAPLFTELADKVEDPRPKCETDADRRHQHGKGNVADRPERCVGGEEDSHPGDDHQRADDEAPLRAAGHHLSRCARKP